MSDPVPSSADISGLGVLQLRGPDSARFLQGQISADCRLLSDQRLLLAGYHTREGRVIAVLRLFAPAPDMVLAILPRDLIDPVIERLRKFVLRAKTQLSNASDEWRLTEIVAAEAPAGALAWPGSRQRWLRVEPAGPSAASRNPAQSSAAKSMPLAAANSAGDAFHAGDIADGVPQVYPSTSEHFVAQMLNLDVLEGIAFDKGCYTGQEVIARAHYRGRVKRRLQRFAADVPVSQLAPGTQGTLADGRAFIVVDAVAGRNGGSEFLAVAHMPDGAAPSAVNDAGAATAPAAATALAAAPAPAAVPAPPQALAAEPLPMPYALPSG